MVPGFVDGVCVVSVGGFTVPVGVEWQIGMISSIAGMIASVFISFAIMIDSFDVENPSATFSRVSFS